MVHSAILQRKFNWPVINLGFSGNGKMEPEVASLLAELDPISLAGGAAFLALLGVAGIVFARWLIRRSRAPGMPVQ